MYYLEDFDKLENDGDHLYFTPLLKKEWDKAYAKPDVFRYKIDNIRKRIINGKYLLLLNPKRNTNRRTPEEFDSILQPFDENKFNFSQVTHNELLFAFTVKDEDVSKEHAILINVSPVSKYHSLICPSIHKHLPQVVTMESLELVIDIMFFAEDRNLRIGYNSLCGMASVNHLHYHLMIEKNTLPIETVKCYHLKGPVYCLDSDYPVTGFCFQLKTNRKAAEDIYKLIDFLLNKSIAHNIFITRGQNVIDSNKGIVRVIIFPRKSCSGAKSLAADNIGFLELSGWFPVFDDNTYVNIQAEDLENNLRKWKYEEFEDLCSDVKEIY